MEKIDFVVHSQGGIRVLKMSDADKRHMEIIETTIKNRWFTEVDVFPKIKRGKYSLNRLYERSQLEIRYTSGSPEYRIKTK